MILKPCAEIQQEERERCACGRWREEACRQDGVTKNGFSFAACIAPLREDAKTFFPKDNAACYRRVTLQPEVCLIFFIPAREIFFARQSGKKSGDFGKIERVAFLQVIGLRKVEQIANRLLG